MKVRLAKTAGFCMGVRRAMEMVFEEANRHKGPIYTFGPLIHNKQVLDLLEEKDVKAVEDIKGLDHGTLLIRAHGIPPQKRKILRSSNLKILDATCPRVAKVQSIIRYNTNKGYTAVIVGDKDHAEVIGLMGYGNGRSIIISKPADVKDLPEIENLIVVAQTTQDIKNYEEITDAIKGRFPHAIVFDTICEATSNRQEEIRSMAEVVDGIVVVGGYHSGNTSRLAQVSKSTGLPTFHVETEKDLLKDQLRSMEVIGVTAGASTPNWMIKTVVKELESIRSLKETVFGRLIRRLFKFLLLSNFLVALGAFSLSHASGILSNRNPDLIHPLMAFLYVYAMRVLNRFLDKSASTYNDPERANFYSKHRIFLILTSITSIIGLLIISNYLGITILIAITGLSGLGIIYSVPIVPIQLRHLWRFSKIKDIPGSKNIMEALAWAAVITLIPMLETFRPAWIPTIITFYVILSMAYVRSAFFDVFQVQGDLIVGKETLPIVLGETKTIFLIKGIVISSIAVLVTTPILGIVSHFAFVLSLSFLSMLLCIAAYEKKSIYTGPNIEYLVEGNLLLSGLLGLIWQLLS